MNYPFLILSFFALCCMICFLPLPVMAVETEDFTTAPTVSQETMESTVDLPEDTIYTEAPETVPDSSEFYDIYQDPVIETEPVYLQVIQETGSALIHANLFGAFLICGTLVGIFLLRGRYGT